MLENALLYNHHSNNSLNNNNKNPLMDVKTKLLVGSLMRTGFIVLECLLREEELQRRKWQLQ
jgi:hypothetical protein